MTQHSGHGPRLSLLWLFAILNILFRDIHEMAMAGTIEDILDGQMNGNPVTEAALLAGAFAVEILLLAFLLSALLPVHGVRWLNLVCAPLAMVGVVFGAPSDPDDYFFAAVVLIALVAIFALAWRGERHHAQ